MTTSKFFLGIVVLGFVLSLALAQSKDLKEISAYLEAWQATERFMGAVLVAKGGMIVFEGGYGLADLETGRSNTPHTAFRLGSLSKLLTATAVLQLQEAGRLTLDDAVGAHLPGYPSGGTITLRHLLTHTSGIPDYTRFPDYLSYMNSPTTLSGLIDRFKNLPLVFPPERDSATAIRTMYSSPRSSSRFRDRTTAYTCRSTFSPPCSWTRVVTVRRVLHPQKATASATTGTFSPARSTFS